MERPFGKYVLTERLGGGGMAEVYRARLRGPEGFEKHLALKLMLPHFSDEPEFVDMFIQEATLAARLDHANIVRIHEFDEVEGRYYIAMELVEGSDLRKIMIRSREIDRPVRVVEVLTVGLEVARGLAFAHGELTPGAPEIVHRDISPHNIIVSRAGEVKVTDFGIAKMASAVPVTRTGVIKGKASYMSPEQARGDPVDRRSDLFSMGCVLWELLTGQRLFSGMNDVAILERLQRGEIPDAAEYATDVPAELNTLLHQMLERDPSKRIDSAVGLARRLEGLLRAGPQAERATLLATLHRELFAVPRARTGVLPTDPTRPTGADGADPSLTGPTLVVEGMVEPVGPDRETRREGEPAGVVLPRPKRGRWLWAGGAAAALAAGALVAGSLGWPNGQPATTGPVQAARGRPSAPRGLEVRVDRLRTAESSGRVTPARVAGEETVGKGKNRPALPPGRLDLNAIPWARVFLRKKLLGDTPLENVELPPGRHTLQLVNQELGITKNVRVHIRPNRRTQKLVEMKK